MTTTLEEPNSTFWESKRQQFPGRPWLRRTPRFKISTTIAALIPGLIVAGLFTYTDTPGAVLMVGVYLPLQLLAAVMAALIVRGRHAALDAIIIVLAIGASIFSLVVLVSVLWSIIVQGFQALSTAFILQNNVYISPTTQLGYGGIGHAIVGTTIIVLIATAISVPIGIATAVYITEVRGRAVPYVRFFVQAMSGVPSVVAGLFILTVMILNGILTQSALAGALAYAILMLPTVARTAEEVLRLIPDDLRVGALALGSTRARMVMKVVLPAARTGLITAAILGVSRVVGETAPLLLTALSNDQTVWNPIADPIASLPTYIFGNVSLPYPAAVTRAWGAALVLMILVAILFITVRFFSAKRFSRK